MRLFGVCGINDLGFLPDYGDSVLRTIEGDANACNSFDVLCYNGVATVLCQIKPERKWGAHFHGEDSSFGITNII